MFAINIKQLKALKYHVSFILSYSVYSKCGHQYKKIFQEESTEILKFLGLIIRKCIILSQENIIQEFRLKNIDETRNYFIKEINQNELMSKTHKKVCRVLNYVELLLILVCTVTGCISIFAFASLLGICIGIRCSAMGIKICVITAGIKKYKSVLIKRKKEAW